MNVVSYLQLTSSFCPQLNTDIALFRNLGDDNYVESIGQSRCAFEDNTAAIDNIPQCPAMVDAVRIGAELRHDTAKFLVSSFNKQYTTYIHPCAYTTFIQYTERVPRCSGANGI